MERVDDLKGKIPPEVEERLEKAVQTFRENHRHPANLALHVAGYVQIARGIGRIFRGKFFTGVIFIGAGVAMILAGHRVEGTDAFAIFKNGASGNGSRH